MEQGAPARGRGFPRAARVTIRAGNARSSYWWKGAVGAFREGPGSVVGPLEDPDAFNLRHLTVGGRQLHRMSDGGPSIVETASLSHLDLLA